MKSLASELEQAVQSTLLADLPALIGTLAKFQATANLRLSIGHAPAKLDPHARNQHAEKYLTVQEVAERFHVKVEWLYRHKKQMPYSQPSRKVVLFPE